MSMPSTFTRQYVAYREAFEGLPVSFEDYMEAEIKVNEVNARFATEKAEQIQLFDGCKEQLAEIYSNNPNAEFKSNDLTTQLGLPNTQGMRARITRELKHLRLQHAA